MAETTGPILAIGAITVANRVIVNNKDMEWRIPIATGIAAMIFALAEKGWARGVVPISYLALFSVLFVRLDKNVPAPVESFVKWWEGGK